MILINSICEQPRQAGNVAFGAGLKCSVRIVHLLALVSVTLAAFLAPAALGQGILYFHAPLTSNNGTPPPGDSYLPEDYLGTQVGPDFSLVINGISVLTLSVYNNESLEARPSASSALIATQPNLAPNPLDPSAFVAPLANGQSIGPDAGGYSWLGTILGGDVLTSSVASGTEGDPFLTAGYFTGLESAYFGFDFQENGQTYYGWMRVGCPYSGLPVGWVYEYAYKPTPNIPIFAGEGIPTPEPSTWALLIGGGLVFSKRFLSHVR